METLFPHVRHHFDSLLDRLLCFKQQEVQVEGWFKGELLFLLSRLKDEGLISGFGREAGGAQGRSRVDVSVVLDDVTHWIELKHWLVGVQRGALLDPPFYFGDPTAVGIVKDVDKLIDLVPQAPKWLLILLTGNPGPELWEKGLARFHRKFTPRRLMPLSDPQQFPVAYFLALLSVHEEK
jgi:hypothetical protein